MVRRGEITDRAWHQIEPLLPEYGQSGGQWRDHRTIINGILWKLRTGSPWRDLPQRYGPWQTCFDRFNRWRRDGTWDRLLAHAQTKNDAVGEVEWEVRRRAILLMATMAAALIVASGVALAETFTCDSTPPCYGTPERDDITGTPAARPST
jgi:transposase